MEKPTDYLQALEAMIRAENDPKVEAWRKEKERVKKMHEAARRGELKL